MNEAMILAMLQNPEEAQKIAEWAESDEGRAEIEKLVKEEQGKREKPVK